MVLNAVKSFKEIEQNLVCGFRSSLFKSDHISIKVLVKASTRFLANYWNATLY